MRSYAELLAENVGQLLHESGLSQVDFGEKVGLSQPAVSRVLKGKMDNPTLQSLEALAKPFGRTVIWLLTDHKIPGSSRAVPDVSALIDGVMALRAAQTPDDTLRDLLGLWPKLDDVGRQEALFAVRAIAKRLAARAEVPGKKPKPS